MTAPHKALLCAAILIAWALMASSLELSAAASFGLLSGLTGAAWGSMHTDAQSANRPAHRCASGCLL